MKASTTPRRSLFLFLFLVSFITPVFSNIINVPGDSTTIQAAILGAAEGDTVLVAAGTYTGPGNRDIELFGKAISVISSDGPANTIIDCEGSGRGFYLRQSEPSQALISGFTVRNAGSYGLFADNSVDATIDNCIFEQTNSYGAYLDRFSGARLLGCTFRNNNAYGIYMGGSQAEIRNCLIYSNNNSGIYSQGNSSPIINCTIFGNTTNGSGGGIHCTGNLELKNSIVWGNTAGNGRANIQVVSSSITFSNVEGGVQGKGNIDLPPAFTNAANGDFSLAPGSPCIDAGDPADDFGLEPAPNGRRINIGAYGNTSLAATGDNEKPIIYSIDPPEGNPQGGTLITVIGTGFNDNQGTLEMDGTPAQILFWSAQQIVAIAPPNEPGRAAVLLTDSEGKSDLRNDGFAYTGAGVLRVPSQYPTIQSAIDFAIDGDTVLVAPDTYTGSGNRDIELFGKAISVISSGGPANTIIDCEGSGRGFYLRHREPSQALISGFTVRNAGSYGLFADNSVDATIDNCIFEQTNSYGAYLDRFSGARLLGCTFRNNNAYGIYMGGSQAEIRNCLIYSNNNSGIYSQGNSSPIINCTIFGNTTNGSGGGIHCTGNLELKNSIVWGNTAGNGRANIQIISSSITFSNVEGGVQGTGNIDLPPAFTNAGGGDFSLAPGSPCIDAGDPEDDFGLEPAPNGLRINIGAYGNTPFAAFGDNGKPVVHNIDPPKGHPNGGTLITVTGTGFNDTQGTLEMDGIPAQILFWSAQQIIAIAPPNEPGRATVLLTNTEGKSDLRNDGFTYTGAGVLRVPAQYSTIQSAIDFAIDGDTVLVAPGTYTGSGNRDIELFGKAISVISSGGPANTIIDCEGSGRGFYLRHREPSQALISGFTVRNAGSYGLFADNSVYATIDNCIFEQTNSYGAYLDRFSRARVLGCTFRYNNAYGIYMGGSLAEVRNCLVYGNNNSGIYSQGNSSPITNCTIFGNTTNGSGGGIHCTGNLQLKNSIVWGNTANNGSPSIETNTAAISFSDIEGGWAGNGNIDMDPVFVNQGNEDFHLQTNSPCIDTGDPADNYLLEPNPNGGRINMGFYGNTAEAALGSINTPVISSLQPIEGTASGNVTDTIYGMNLGSSPGSVYFGDSLASLVSWAPDQIICRTPRHPKGPVDVRIITSDLKNVAAEKAFTFTDPLPLKVPQDYLTIQEAIDSAFDGDIVLIAPGIYTGTGNNNIRTWGKAIMVTSEAGPKQTIIDCENAARGFNIRDGETNATVINGLTIRNAGDAIFCNDSDSPTIENCIFEQNGQAVVLARSTSTIVRNCIMRRNTSYGCVQLTSYNNDNVLFQNCLIVDNENLAVRINDGAPRFVNCTIANNEGGINMQDPDAILSMRNCIVWGNQGNIDPNISAARTEISYSNIEGGLPGAGNFQAEPQFSDTLYHLSAGSPCIDAGSPLDDYALEPIPNGERINIGAYGNTPEAATGTNGLPALATITPAEGSPDGGSVIVLQGKRFGNSSGQVLFDNSTAAIASWADTTIILTTPAHFPGKVTVRLVRSDGAADSLAFGYRYTGPAILRVPQVFTTIQAAIDVASEGDTVLIAPGTYTGTGNRNVRTWGKAIMVTSEAGPGQTILDCENAARGFYIHDGETNATVINGLTIRNAGDAIFCDNSDSPTIENCILEQNGQAIVLARSTSTIIRNCIMRRNTAYGCVQLTSYNNDNVLFQNCLIVDNGNLAVRINDDAPRFINCTIANNNGGISMRDSDGILTMRNCIVRGNQSNNDPNIFAAQADISYSNIEGGLPGAGNFQSDPLFSDTLYHLSAGSPCIDAGSPLDEYTLEPIPNGERINVGAYGNTPEAATGMDAKPSITSISPAEGAPDGGNVIILLGKRLGNSTGQVLFGGTPATISNWADTAIVLTTPVHKPGKVTVRLVRSDGAADSLAFGYRYTGPAVLRVPSVFATIQAAVDAASETDTVLVAPGTYTGVGNRNIRTWGKAITIISETGPGQTILDCINAAYGFYIRDGETNATVISGLTIRNASDAIYCDAYDSPVIENCILEQNGQAIVLGRSTSTIVRNCIMRHNTSFGCVRLTSFNNDNVLFQNCLIVDNGSTAIRISQDAPFFLNCTIANNNGGVSMQDTNEVLTMRNCIVWGNESNISADQSDISYSCIEGGWSGTGNIAVFPIFAQRYMKEDYHLHPSSPCIDAGDPADDYSREPTPNGNRINMGFYGNSPEATSFEPLPVITDHLIEPSCDAGTRITFEGVFFGSSGTVSIAGEVIPSSSAIVWSDTLIEVLLPTNLIGENSITVANSMGTDSIPGFYTMTSEIEYVSGDVSGTWTKECPGTYVLTGDVTVPDGETLTIEPGVSVLVNTDSAGIYARFTVRGTLNAVGTETDSIVFSLVPYQKTAGNWYGLTLDMDASNEGADLKFCKVELARTGITARHDQIDIENSTIANNTQDGVSWRGGSNENASGTLKNCTIRDNGGHGVKVYASCGSDSGRASPTIDANYILNNASGGIDINAIAGSPPFGVWVPSAQSARALPRIINNYVINNSGLGIECEARGNAGSVTVGSFRFSGTVRPVIEGNIVAGNEGSFYALAPYNDSGNWLSTSEPRLLNNTFYDNGATDILAGDSAKITITNSIFYGGQASAIEYENGGKIFASYSTFEESIPGTGNLSEDPQFVDPSGGDFRLYAASPCIDAGQNNAVNESTDIEGVLRIADGNGDGDAVVDMGAIEYHLPEITSQPLMLVELCEGETVSLSVTAEGANLIYQWRKDGIDLPNATADQLEIANASANDSGAYTCAITDELGGMVSSNEAQLIVTPLAEASITITAPTTSICENELLTFTATPENGGTIPGFQWLLNGNTVGDNSSSWSFDGFQNGDHVSCLLQSSERCVLNDTAFSNQISLTVNPLPDPDISGVLDFCEGDSTTLTASGGSSFEWSNGDTTAIITVYNGGMYSVIATDDNGCSNTAVATVTVNPLPVISFPSDCIPDTLMSNDPPLTLDCAEPQGGNYLCDGIPCSQFDPSNANLGEHTITYTFTDQLGCQGEASTSIFVIMSTGTSNRLDEQTIFAYPNPSAGDFLLQAKGLRGNLEINIVNVLGQSILRTNWNVSQQKTYLVSLEDQPAGIYHAVFRQDDVVRVIQLVLQ